MLSLLHCGHGERIEGLGTLLGGMATNNRVAGDVREPRVRLNSGSIENQSGVLFLCERVAACVCFVMMRTDLKWGESAPEGELKEAIKECWAGG